MKKLRSLLLTLLLGVILAACGGNTGTNPNADSPAAGDETPQAGDGSGTTLGEGGSTTAPATGTTTP